MNMNILHYNELALLKQRLSFYENRMNKFNSIFMKSQCIDIIRRLEQRIKAIYNIYK